MHIISVLVSDARICASFSFALASERHSSSYSYNYNITAVGNARFKKYVVKHITWYVINVNRYIIIYVRPDNMFIIIVIMTNVCWIFINRFQRVAVSSTTQ